MQKSGATGKRVVGGGVGEVVTSRFFFFLSF